MVKKLSMIFISFSLLFLFRCEEKTTLTSDANFHEQLSALESENHEHNQKINLLENEIKELNYKDSYAYFAESKNAFYEKYPLLNEDSWDRIVITKPGNEYEVSITDPLIVKDVADQLIGGYYPEVDSLPNGPHSDVPNYQYTLIKGDQKQVIEVAARGMVNIDGVYYYTMPEIHLLGDAFYMPPAYINTDETPIFTKLAFSGYLRGTEKYSIGVFSRFRNMGVIYPLVDEAKLLDQKPTELYDLHETFYFYFFGEEITVNIFEEKYVQVIDNQNEYWYELDDPTSVGAHLSAG